jgi:serine/threonine-protein kinase PRP4
MPIAIVKHRDRESMTASPGPADFLLAKDDEQEDAQVKRHAANAGAEQVSAADYDPSLDRREDEQKRFGNGKGDEGDVGAINVDDEEEEEDDVDDMFAVAASDVKKTKKVKKQKTVVVRPFYRPCSRVLSLILASFRNQPLRP